MIADFVHVQEGLLITLRPCGSSAAALHCSDLFLVLEHHTCWDMILPSPHSFNAQLAKLCKSS